MHAASAERDAFRRGQRAVVSAHAPGHLRAHRRSAGTRAGQAVSPGARFARFPDGARAPQELHRHAARSGRVLRRRDQGAQVQQRGRRPLRPRRVAAARGGPEARQGRARCAREDRAAASDGRGDGRPRAHGVGRSRRRHRALQGGACPLPEQDAARLRLSGRAAQGQAAQGGHRLPRPAARSAFPTTARCIGSAAQAYADMGKRMQQHFHQASSTRGRATSGAPCISSSRRPRPATATSTRRRSSKRGCGRCAASSRSSRPPRPGTASPEFCVPR